MPTPPSSPEEGEEENAIFDPSEEENNNDITVRLSNLAHEDIIPIPSDKMHFSALLLLGLGGLTQSTPSSTHTVHEKRHALPVAWTKHSRAQKDVIVPVRVGLKQRNLEHSDRFLEDISDPDSPNFGRLPPTKLSFDLLKIQFRKALDCRKSCQHLCATPGSFRHYS
jgi:hypothetical protein